MNIKKSVQNIITAVNFTMALGFASYIQADATSYMGAWSEEVASIESYSSPKAGVWFDEASFNEQKSNEDRIGEFLYKTIDDPEKVLNQVAGTAILYGLDTIGLGDSLREGIDFIKKNTRYSFGDCGNVQLKTSQITAESCLSNGGSVEFNADYDFNSVEVEFKWAI